MTKEDQLKAYAARSPEYCLIGALGDLTNAMAYAVRAGRGLPWLTSVKDSLAHVDQHIAEYREFIAALEAEDEAALQRFFTDHSKRVDDATLKYRSVK